MRRGAAVSTMALGVLLMGVPLAFGYAVDGSLGVRGMSEEELQEAETAILGPEHAAEHARQRKLLREEEGPEPFASVKAGSPEPILAAYDPSDPAQAGRWNAPFSVPITGTHAVMLPTGKVMWWSFPNGAKSSNSSQAWLWDPATGQSNRVDPPLWLDPADGQLKPANIWCSGQALLADGRVLVTGGNLAYTGGTPNFRGLNKVYTFNPFNETWTEQPDMPHGRWYPSQRLLPDGRVLIIGGYDETGDRNATGQWAQNTDIEVFTPSQNMDGVGTLTQIGSRGGTGNPPMGELYPHLFQMPSGRTLVAGPDPADSWFFNTIGPSSFTWSNIANMPTSRLWGAGVPNPGAPSGSTKITLTGGKDYTSGPVQATTAVYDEAAPGLGWQAGASMNVARAHHNTVLLPDGGMATFGGGVGKRTPEGLWAADPEHHQVELFDPATNSWRVGPSQVENRAYHSTAVLLPDGRVISAGSEDYFATAGRDTAEIYEPPYLFKGPRPEVDSAPQSVNWADEFGIASDSDVSRATLVAPAATTHANDMNQRHVELEVTEDVAGAGLNVKAPPSNLVAQPGYYMLFLLNADGVPSVAHWIRLDGTAPDRPKLDPGPPAPDLPPTAVADLATLAEDAAATPIDVLANDTDPDGGTKSIQSASDPDHGTTAITGGGTGLTYRPDADYCGADSFSYTLNGGSQASVAITVSCVDDGPNAVADSASVTEDSAASAVDVLGNDTDPDGGTKSIQSASDPPHGTSAVTGGGTGLTYRPDADYCGSDDFSYTLNGGSTAGVSVTVTCVDDVPTAVADSATVSEDAVAALLPVLGNDTDSDGGTKSIQSASDPAHGTTAVTGGGSGLTYAPDSNYCGPDSFSYALNGGSTATVSVMVSCVDDNPTAVADSATVTEDSGPSAIDALANDTDIDGGPKTISSVSDAPNGIAAITGGGTGLTYTPDAEYCGADSFTYALNGGSTATVSITVSCVGDLPVAVNDSATRGEDSGAGAIDVLANDTDVDGGPKNIQSASDPAHGTTAVTGGGTGLTYAPDPNYCGADGFTYALNGGSTATVSVNVTCVDDTPTAVADSSGTFEDAGAIWINALANDSDDDGGPKTIVSVSDPPHGTAWASGGGISYTPDFNYCGADSFTYALNGGSTATVSIMVICVDDPPTALNDAATVAQNASATPIYVLANDPDPDGGPKMVVAASAAAHGSVAVASGGQSITYRPDRDYCGADSFTYTLNGGSSASVAITVKRGKRRCRK